MKIKLQEILDSRNISVYSLSKEIGVTQNNLGKLIKGETTSIKYDILEKLCNVLNITPNDIFEIEKPKSPYKLSAHQAIKNAKVFEEKHGYNPIISDEALLKMELEQDRLDLEYNFETNVNKILNNIIDTYDPTIQEHYKELIKTYSDNKDAPLSYKLTTLYRVIYRLLSIHSDSQLRDFITKLRNIYMDGDLIKLNDEELKNLYDNSIYYLNLLNSKQKD
jgi:putative transcriptional regulator